MRKCPACSWSRDSRVYPREQAYAKCPISPQMSHGPGTHAFGQCARQWPICLHLLHRSVGAGRLGPLAGIGRGLRYGSRRMCSLQYGSPRNSGAPMRAWPPVTRHCMPFVVMAVHRGPGGSGADSPSLASASGGGGETGGAGDDGGAHPDAMSSSLGNGPAYGSGCDGDGDGGGGGCSGGGDGGGAVLL